MWKRFIAWLDADGEVRRLARLDDRLLADIGVQRETLRAEVLGRPEPEARPSPEDAEPELCVALAARS